MTTDFVLMINWISTLDQTSANRYFRLIYPCFFYMFNRLAGVFIYRLSEPTYEECVNFFFVKWKLKIQEVRTVKVNKLNLETNHHLFLLNQMREVFHRELVSYLLFGILRSLLSIRCVHSLCPRTTVCCTSITFTLRVNGWFWKEKVTHWITQKEAMNRIQSGWIAFNKWIYHLYHHHIITNWSIVAKPNNS